MASTFIPKELYSRTCGSPHPSISVPDSTLLWPGELSLKSLKGHSASRWQMSDGMVLLPQLPRLSPLLYSVLLPRNPVGAESGLLQWVLVG